MEKVQNATAHPQSRAEGGRGSQQHSSGPPIQTRQLFTLETAHWSEPGSGQGHPEHDDMPQAASVLFGPCSSLAPNVLGVASAALGMQGEPRLWSAPSTETREIWGQRAPGRSRNDSRWRQIEFCCKDPTSCQAPVALTNECVFERNLPSFPLRVTLWK